MMLGGLTSFAEPWATFFSDHAVVRTGVTFAHLCGLLLAGGLAVANDRTILRTRRAPDAERPVRLQDLRAAHSQVIAGLGVVLLSGLLLFLADLETYLTSWIFWTKMALVVTLLRNGVLLRRAAQAVEGDPELDMGWRLLRRRATASLSLWVVITLMGTALIDLA